MLALVTVLAATRVAAQSAGGDTPDDSTGAGQTHRQHRRAQSGDQPKQAAVAEPHAGPEPWPRLDPGAVFCRTADDLRQHLAAITARLDGNGTAAEAPGCSVIRDQTAIVIVAREAPGRTQVRMSNAPGDTGWTDAFLPNKSNSP